MLLEAGDDNGGRTRKMVVGIVHRKAGTLGAVGQPERITRDVVGGAMSANDIHVFGRCRFSSFFARQSDSLSTMQLFQ